MDAERKKQSAIDLSHMALVGLASAVGLIEPIAGTTATMTATGLGRLLDRFTARWHQQKSFLADAQEKILTTLDQQTTNAKEVEIAMATAMDAVSKHGISARRFAALRFDPEAAASEVVKHSKYHHLEYTSNEDNQQPLARQLLVEIYRCFLTYEDHHHQLERAFEDTVLEMLTHLPNLEKALHPLVESNAWTSILRLPKETIRPDTSPTLLLTPRHEILPYQQRDEDEGMRAWLENDAQVGIRIIQARGGAGKTRWLLQQCQQLDSGWRKGFLEERYDIPHTAYQSLFHGATRILVVVDYVENRQEQFAKLLDHAADAAMDQPVRIVAITRGLDKAWWDALRIKARKEATRSWLTVDSQVLETINLSPLTPEPTRRDELFQISVQAITATGLIKQPVTDYEYPDLSADFYGDPLFIQLAALSLLRGGEAPLNDQALLETTLDHEARYWHCESLERSAIEPLFALITLWQGMDTGGVSRILEAWPNPDSPVRQLRPDKAASMLGRLYPAEGGIAPLLPDRLGEAMVARVLNDDRRIELLDAAFSIHSKDQQLLSAFATLGRITSWHNEGTGLWSNLLWDDPVELGHISHQITQLLKQRPDHKFAVQMMSTLPDSSLGMAELTAEVERIALTHLKTNPTDGEAYQAELARITHNLGVRLAKLGQHEAALDKTYEATKLRRELARQRPNAYRPDLASSLNNLANCLSALGQREQALEAAKEAVDLRRELDRHQPHTYLHNLATSLITLTRSLSDLDLLEQALEAAHEAVEIHRELIQLNPETFQPDLSMSLSTLAICHLNLGQREQALDNAHEAVELRRELTRKQPDIFRPDLAKSLSNLASIFTKYGLRTQAMVVACEAVEHQKELFQQWPDAFRSDLTTSLNNLSNCHSYLGQHEQALKAAREAVSLRRELVLKLPNAFRPDLASSLNNMSNCLSNLGQSQEALMAAREAVELRRELFQQQPDAFRSDLALSLGTLANRFSKLGQHKQALEAADENVDLYRVLDQQHPDAFRPDLAMSLNNLANYFTNFDQPYEALVAARESVEYHQELFLQQTDTFRPDLAMSLGTLADCLSNLGQRNKALEAGHKAVELYRELKRQRPDVFQPNLSRSLATLGRILSEEEGQLQNAKALLTESIEQLCGHFLQFPQAHASLMGTITHLYINICVAIGEEPDGNLLAPVVAKIVEIKK